MTCAGLTMENPYSPKTGVTQLAKSSEPNQSTMTCRQYSTSLQLLFFTECHCHGQHEQWFVKPYYCLSKELL